MIKRWIDSTGQVEQRLGQLNQPLNIDGRGFPRVRDEPYCNRIRSRGGSGGNCAIALNRVFLQGFPGSLAGKCPASPALWGVDLHFLPRGH
jgi:hypothetical protein